MVKIGVKVRRDGNTKLSGCRYSRPAQRPLRRNMHEIRPLSPPEVHQNAFRRKPEIQAVIERDLPSSREQLTQLVGVATRLIARLARADELDAVPSRDQTFDHLSQR